MLFSNGFNPKRLQEGSFVFWDFHAEDAAGGRDALSFAPPATETTATRVPVFDPLLHVTDVSFSEVPASGDASCG
jgi:hypothetical protein